MWCGKCGISHPQNKPCKYQDVSKSLWCSTCGGRQNDHIKGCPVEKGTFILQICRKTRMHFGLWASLSYLAYILIEK